MPLTTQTKILRVLQEGEISRVGSNAVAQDRRAHHRRHEQGPLAGGAAEGIPRGPFLPPQRRAREPAAAARAHHRRAAARRIISSTSSGSAPAHRPDADRRRRHGGDPAPSVARQRARTGKLRPARHGPRLRQHHHARQSAGGNRARHPPERADASRRRNFPPAFSCRAGSGQLERSICRPRRARQGRAGPRGGNALRLRAPATRASSCCPPPSASSSSARWPRPPATRCRPPSCSASPAPRSASGSTSSASRSAWRSTDRRRLFL